MEKQWFRIFLVDEVTRTRIEIAKVRSRGLCNLLLLKLREIYYQDRFSLEVE